MSANRSTAAPPRAPIVPIAFNLPPGFGERHAELVGEFVAWSPLPMDRDAHGGFSIVIGLEQDRRWGYRFVLDGTVTLNDPEATEYMADGTGGHVSVVRT